VEKNMASLAAVVANAGGASEANLPSCLVRELGAARVAAIAPEGYKPPAGVAHIAAARTASAQAVVECLRWFAETGASHLLWALSPLVETNPSGLRRLLAAATDSSAAILYSDYFDRDAAGKLALHPLVDYQPGSLRDDFDFGQTVLFSKPAVANLAMAIEGDRESDEFGGWYDLRLRASEQGSVLRLPEPTYVMPPVEPRSATDAHFSYVDPRNRGYQVEMERVATAHLKRIGAFLSPPAEKLVPETAPFPVEASVIIPVRNRERTVADAVRSALDQQASFEFNVVVVDNHSTDGTTKILADLAAAEPRLKLVVPDRLDLGIGGCWNEAIYSQHCGRYAVQLDSDDLYSSIDVLERVVGEFRKKACAMVVGSYTIVDFNLKQIPPGLIDHREWTDENGHNNALRIHGLGAPRAFHVPTLRTIGFPNTSYGEDYAVAIQLSRRYPVRRIYESLYWCRRWEDNTDHALPLDAKNRYAHYKDRLRTVEIAARQAVAR
jgi:hypothetical protein